MNEHILAAVRQYLDVHPEEHDTLAPLLDLATGSEPVASRRTVPGHVTCGAIAVGEDRGVLQIRHRSLDRWLLPGGHVEADDRTLLDAAVRELAEETGISASAVTPIAGYPIDIDAHEIPENLGKGEPAHTHYDFRFLLGIQPLGPGTGVDLQLEEVTAHRWVPATELTGRLGGKVTAALHRA
ncbi:NUDIX hydrolase [Frankia umida]|uniref:NUDIX hydrolase n=1 Tax=Frankia umida TaxID=573489 RepID=UPI0023ABF168|nr:NUDIX domain-containing protein [Frankia umida]